VLTVSSGAQTAKINLLGNYVGSKFKVASDAHGGTTVIDPASGASAATQPFVQSMAAFAAPAAADAAIARYAAAAHAMLAVPRRFAIA
jgi:hypothetical protein